MGLAALFFPKHCMICKHIIEHRSSHLCVSCASSLYLSTYEYNRIHPMHLQFAPQVVLEVAYSPFINSPYAAQLIQVLHALKYKKQLFAAKVLCTLASPQLSAFFERHNFDIIVPVPSHFLKKLKRGYNPAEVLAREIAKEQGIALGAKLLSQPKRKATQALNNKHQRANIQLGTFRAKISQKQKKLHMLLIDDECTTGATMAACYWALKKQGVEKVSFLSLFFTPLEYEVKATRDP